MKLSELVTVFRDIKAIHGDIEVCINNQNVIENIIVISKTSGSIVSMSGDKHRAHPIIAQGTTINRKAFYQEFL